MTQEENEVYVEPLEPRGWPFMSLASTNDRPKRLGLSVDGVHDSRNSDTSSSSPTTRSSKSAPATRAFQGHTGIRRQALKNGKVCPQF